MIIQLVVYWITNIFQRINFIGRPEDDRATMFFIIEKSEETASEFSQKSVSII